MKTWTIEKGNISAVVTADNVDMAINILKTKLGLNCDIKRQDLIPLSTTTRCARILQTSQTETET